MNDTTGQKSKTALAVLTFLAAAESERDLEVRIHDPIAPRLIRWSDGIYASGKSRMLHSGFRKATERSDPGAYGFMIARALYMDDVIRQEAAEGIEQLVILGAGYDTRAYRMRDELGDVRVFEVDLPSMSQDKRARVKKALGAVPEDVSYVEADFTGQNFTEILSGHGYDDSAQTLFVLSGVSMYLPEEAVLGLFSQVAEHSSARTSIVFDYFFDDLRTAPERYYGAGEWIARANKSGEEPLYGLSMEDAGTVLASRGLRLVSHADMAELSGRYLRRTDGTVVARPYDFAAMAHAAVVG